VTLSFMNGLTLYV